MKWINKNKCVPHMKLDIGSGNPLQGEIQPNGYVLNDVEPHENIDLVCDIKYLSKYVPDGYCSEIRASHILEHFGTKEVIEVIKMIHSLLEPNGALTIYVPNFKWHAELVLSGNDEDGVHYAFGGQLDQYDYHKTGFTPKILRKYLEENSFKIISMVDSTSIECHAIAI
jgi:predicted SAM-dependent methyltransferase